MIFLQQFKPDNLSQAVTQKGVLAVQREIILQYILNTLLGIYTIGFAGILLFSAEIIRSNQVWMYLVVYLVLAAVTIIRAIPYPLRAGVLVTVLQGLGAAALISYGLSGTGITFLFAGILLAILLFTFKQAVVFLASALGILVGIGSGMVTGRIDLPPVEVMANSGSSVQWFTAGLVLVFAVSITAVSVYAIMRGLNKSVLQQEKLTKELETDRKALENRVHDRATDLAKRVDQFEIASEIAHEISSETNIETLLATAANHIREKFNFYHVGVFINDERNEYAVLRAATGEAGRMMLERNHRLKIGEIGMVGYVISRGEARVTMDVSGDNVHYKNPMLPETRSEMALPLRSGQGVIGALDVQSVLENAFDNEDIRILQMIADQLAIAFDKTRLVDQLQRSVSELESSARTASQKAWRTHMHNTRQRLAYRYANAQLDTQVRETEQAKLALTEGKPVLKPAGVDAQGKPVTVLAVPIRLRNHVLGVVDLRFESASVSPELIALIEGTVNRLAISLENARLLEEIRFRAERERLVGEISTKVRAASDVDSVLQIAIQEIGKSLGVAEVMVQLRKDS